jgi:hypothetical protein
MAASSDHRKPLDIGRRQAVLALALLDGSRTNLDWTPSRKAAAVKQWHSRYNNGMVESPRPRRFQFRLLTLLIFVSLFCVICGWAFHQVHVVQERKTLLEQVIEHEGFYVTGSMHVRTGR